MWESSQVRDHTGVPALQVRFLTTGPPGKPWLAVLACCLIHQSPEHINYSCKSPVWYSSVPATSGSDACLSLQTVEVFLPFDMLCSFALQLNIVFWVEGTAVNRRLVIWWWGVGGEEVLYSPVIRAQALSEPVSLQCELHKHFSVFLFPLRWGRMARMG